MFELSSREREEAQRKLLWSDAAHARTYNCGAVRRGFADVHGGLETFDEVLKSLGHQVEAKFLGQNPGCRGKLARTYEEAGRAVPTEKLDEASFLFGF